MLKLRVKKAFCNSFGIAIALVECREIKLDVITIHKSYLLFRQLNEVEDYGAGGFHYENWDYRPVVELKEKLELLNFQDCTQNINFWETVMAQIPDWNLNDHEELHLD